MLIATRWVYRARYFNTCSGPPNGGLAYTTQSVRTAADTSRSNSVGSRSGARPSANAARSPARNLPRNTRLRTRTGRKKLRARADPAGAVRGQPATGHDAMDVRVELKVLAPGVQHGQHAGLGTQVLGIGGHLEHGLGGGPQEQVVDDPRIGQCDRVEGIREREDEMEVRHREQVGGAGLQPPCRGRGLAGGAVAVAAGVVGDLLMPALGAPQDMTTQGRRAAGGQVVQGAALLGRQLRTVLVPGTRRDSSG